MWDAVARKSNLQGSKRLAKGAPNSPRAAAVPKVLRAKAERRKIKGSPRMPQKLLKDPELRGSGYAHLRSPR